MTSYLVNLHCSVCAKQYSPDVLQTYCPDCRAPLLADYDLDAARQHLDRDELSRQSARMWRWQALLPVRESENIVSLGEGDTPLLHLQRIGSDLGLPHLYVKDESLNPTATFKARGLAAAVSKAKELGVQKVIIPTAGNAGGAMAAYAARGGLQAYIVMPRDTPAANIQESQVAGAEVELIDGLISDAARRVMEKSALEGWFDLSTFKEPYRVEGKKIMGYELAESFGWSLPDVILYPTGGGTGLVGMWKAFDELADLGWLESSSRPRMVSIQVSGCAPVVKAFDENLPYCDFWESAQTVASGLRVPKSFADRLILENIRQSNGKALAVSDQELLEQQRVLASREGIFAAPEGAATLAGLLHLLEQGWIKPHESVILFNTGSGLKYLK